MELQIERNGEKKEVKTIIIYVGDSQFRIQQLSNGIVINKVDFNSNSININPKVSNEIVIY